MSQSPLEAVGRNEATDYFEAIDRWSRLVEAGNSHSGNEKNCAFLNLDGSGFAGVSAVSGLNFGDDARAVAPVDWDQDGDLDLWLSNRTGPQLRLLRNDTPAGQHSVSLRLTGESVNRDAIGARLELYLEDGGPVRVRTLKAGAGFLSQGSKWVHFGLGDATGIERVVVRWPGAEAETFRGVAADGRYRLLQGSGKAAPVAPRQVAASLSPAPMSEPETTGRAGIRLASRPPAPRVHYRDWKDEPRTWDPATGNPRLLNFWASWCAPCAAELSEFAQRRRDFKARGVEILALSVDGLGDARGGDPSALEAFLRQLDFPFTAGTASAEIVDKFELLFTQMFGRHVSLPVPASFLIDAGGNLAAIYLGRVEVDDLLADLDGLQAGPEELRDRATAFSGTWLLPPRAADLGLLAREYLRAGYAEDAEPLLRAELGSGGAESRQLLATALQLLERNDEAERLYREALSIDPGNARAHYNLAQLLAADGRDGDAVSELEAVLRVEPDNVHAHLAIAASLQRVGGAVKALTHYRRALELKPGWGPAANALVRQLAAGADPRVRDVPTALLLAQQVCQASGFKVADLVDTLAIAYAASGRFEEALETGRKAAELALAADRAEYAQEIEVRLRMFAERKAWVEPY